MQPEAHANRLGIDSIPRLLWDFSLPTIVGMVANALYYFIDRYFIGGTLQATGLAAMHVTFPLSLILMGFSMLAGFGAAALVSIRLGQHHNEDAQIVLGNCASLLVLLSILISIGGYFYIDRLLVLFGASEAILPYARDYAHIILLGAVCQLLGFGLNAIIRAEGNPRISMLTMLLSVVVNAILAPIFIFGLGWGMKGAGWATVGAQASTAVWVLCYFNSKYCLLRLRLRNLVPHPALFGNILAFGAPAFAMQIAASLLNSIINYQLKNYGGDTAISMMSIIYSCAMLIFMPIFGLNQGTQPIIGYNYGAKLFPRVRKTLWIAVLAASCFCAAGFVVVMLYPSAIVNILSKGDPNLMVMGNAPMRLALLAMPLLGFQVVCSGYFQAVGKPRQAMVLMLSRQLLLLIPAVLILPLFFGLTGVWMSMPTADILSTVLAAVYMCFEMPHLSAAAA